jgi:hypothetical protein
MNLWTMIWLTAWALIFFVVGIFGFLFGYLWRKSGEKKTITEAVKAVRDYEAVKTENDCLREVIAKRDKEIDQLERDRKILEACNVDLAVHNCKCGKKKVIDDEVRMQPVPKTKTEESEEAPAGFTVDLTNVVTGEIRVSEYPAQPAAWNLSSGVFIQSNI